MKIRAKILLYYNVFLFTSISILGFIILTSLNKYIINNTVKRLSDRIFMSQEIYIPEYNKKDILQSFNEHAETIALNLSKNNSHVRVYSLSGLLKDASSGIIVAYSSKDFKINNAVQNALEGKNAYLLDDDIIYYAVPVKWNNTIVGSIEYVYPLSDELKIMTVFKRIFLLASLVSIASLFIISIYIANIITNPIKQLDDAAKKIAEGNFSEIVIKSKDEIGSLASSFNTMGKAIREYILKISDEKSKLNMVLSNINEGVAAVDDHGNFIFKNPIIDKFIEDNSDGILKEISISCFKYGHVIKDFTSHNKILKIDASVHNAICIMVIHDITSDRQIVKKQRDFISNVSHELKTPVTAITGYVDILKSEKEYDDTVIEYLSSESIRLKNLVLELLEVSRLDSYEAKLDRRTVNLSLIIEGILNNMSLKAGKFNIKIQRDIQMDVIALLDGNKISQAIINLVDNAVKYSKPGGTIEVNLYTKDNAKYIEIKDSGIGIKNDEIGKIFDRFYRSENASVIGGNGLGLSIVKEIIEKHEGKIEVKSKLNEGSIFTLILPD